MTSQSRADALLTAWQLLRLQGLAPELRLPVIDALCEIERVKDDLQIEPIPPGPYVDPWQRGANPEPIGSTLVVIQ